MSDPRYVIKVIRPANSAPLSYQIDAFQPGLMYCEAAAALEVLVAELRRNPAAIFKTVAEVQAEEAAKTLAESTEAPPADA